MKDSRRLRAGLNRPGPPRPGATGPPRSLPRNPGSAAGRAPLRGPRIPRTLAPKIWAEPRLERGRDRPPVQSLCLPSTFLPVSSPFNALAACFISFLPSSLPFLFPPAFVSFPFPLLPRSLLRALIFRFLSFPFSPSFPPIYFPCSFFLFFYFFLISAFFLTFFISLYLFCRSFISFSLPSFSFSYCSFFFSPFFLPSILLSFLFLFFRFR